MIYVTQGHEEGIGLEIFIKSFLLVNKNFQKKFKLFCFKKSLFQTLKNTNIEFEIKDSHLIINSSYLELEILNNKIFSESNSCILEALKVIKPDDILLTLPTSKDQFHLKNKTLNGHTEFFREYFNNQSISMNFISNNFNVCLLTDHISISKVEDSLTEEFIIQRVSSSLKSFEKLLNIKEIIFSGINPHNGEDGLISNKDKVISIVIDYLKNKLPDFKFHGPYPADTIHSQGINDDKLFVYTYHDQALNPFKLYNGLVGINISFGMPFIRMSVDHGTAFNLFGKNSANYNGMSYLLNFIQKKAQV
jgi:4-hydroxythreonine-4-phosphate dehydrogenase